ncbi:MAG TPA: hypothetical protein VKB49_02755 [Candidatus Sulfotelmatobacter sp.]|nr:hypothetical protein [Candidatus Sulfotelmatobacter sp.]
MKQDRVIRNLKGLTPALLAAFLCLSVPISMFAADDADSTAVGTMTVEGLVRDIACPLQNKKSTSASFSKECITMCLKSGSPLGILTREGEVYVPVTQSMPDMGQDALKPFVGEHVKATGKVFLRNGTHAIEISKIDRLAEAVQSK